jgi:hypothetical protein
VADGNYTFWIASDDAGELWLSTDIDPGHKTKIAYLTGSVNPYKWDKNASQKSAAIPLVAGRKYYIEALHKEGSGGDSIAVAWQGPGIIRQPITGAYLSIADFVDFTAFADHWGRDGCDTTNAWCGGADRDRDGAVLLEDLSIFADEWLFGPG